MKTLILLLITATCAFAQTPEEFYARLNKIRKAKHLPALQIDPKLEASSEAWIKKLKGKMWHDYSNYYGEVMARCFDATDCWMESKPHKKTILGRKYRFVGYAIVYFEGIPVACARFR